MANIQTVTLTGSEAKVEGLGGQNTLIVNRGSENIYVSAYADIVPYGDNVALVLPGSAMNLCDTNGTVYLLGTGKVQLQGTNTADLPIVLGGVSGGGGSAGVSQEYVDNADAATLLSAKGYTDDEITSVREEIPVIPESLPANGGNAETAKRLALYYVGSAANNVTSPELYKIGEYHMDASYIDFQTISLVVYDPCHYGFIGILTCDVYGGSNHGIVNPSLEWALLVNNINLENFIIAFTPYDTNPGTITLYFRSNSSLPRIGFSVINNLETRPLMSTRLWTLFDGLDVISEVIPSEYIQQISTMNIIQNDSAEAADLKAYIGYTDSDIYGLEADFENNKFIRLAGAVGKNPGADFDSIHAFGGRRRCCILSNGIVTAYYGDDNFDEDGWDESINSFVQVMVEQPKFYYKVVPLKTEKIDGTEGYHLRKARYYISDTPKSGFKIHPAFIRNGIETDRIYLSAYEGCIKSGGSYLREDEQTADFNTDSLSSIINTKPASGTTQELTIDNARKLAQNRGVGWGVTTIQTLSATQLLFAIEYATFNSQRAIGDGNTQYDQLPNTGNNAMKTGATSSLGNSSGAIVDNNVQAISYRGEENLWGNMFNFVDGIINVPSENFSSTSASGKIKINTDTLPSIYLSGGYTKSFVYSDALDYTFFSGSNTGNSALPIGDRVWNALETGTIMLSGGLPHYGNTAGLFCYSLEKTEETHNRSIGARLVYIPQPAAQEVTAND